MFYRQAPESESRRNSNCINCGAVMKYNHKRDVFECQYCGNTSQYKTDAKWEIVDIEIGN